MANSGDFYKIEVCGITDSERDAVLYDFSDISGNKSLMDILKIPMFLNMYLESNSDELNTRGEILDFYIMNWKSKSSEIFETGNENDTIHLLCNIYYHVQQKICWINTILLNI